MYFETPMPAVTTIPPMAATWSDRLQPDIRRTGRLGLNEPDRPEPLERNRTALLSDLTALAIL
jgi:hypothetical protein